MLRVHQLLERDARLDDRDDRRAGVAQRQRVLVGVLVDADVDDGVVAVVLLQVELVQGSVRRVALHAVRLAEDDELHRGSLLESCGLGGQLWPKRRVSFPRANSVRSGQGILPPTVYSTLLRDVESVFHFNALGIIVLAFFGVKFTLYIAI